jgi:hypothetical protein
MKRFLLKIGLFIVILFGIQQSIDQFTPYHWGNFRFSSKVRYLNKKDLNPNVYYFGSSKVYRHFEASYFDSLLEKKDGKPYKSFNMGSPNTFAPQTYYLLNNFMESDLGDKADVIFVELSGLAIIAEDQMHRPQTTYCQDGATWSLILNSCLKDDNKGIGSAKKFMTRYTVAWIENLFNIGHYRNYLGKNEYKDEYVGPKLDGHLSLEYEYSHTKDKSVIRALNDRKGNIKKIQRILKERKKIALVGIRKQHELAYDRAHSEYCKYLISKFQSRGVHLIFVLGPGAKEADLTALYVSLPKMNRIELADPNLYPEFYQLDYVFDHGHLNDKGARLFTYHLAQNFKKLSLQ